MSAAMPNASYSITLRLRMSADDPSAIGRTTTAIGEAAGAVTALDFVETQRDVVVIDVTVNAGDAAHAEGITDAVDALDGVEVHRVSDRTFLLHLRGKLEVRSRVPLATRDDLSMAYTPGVARVCRAIADTPDDARRLTIKGNTVAIVTDGSAVLGLGDIGPAAALPVMEGKAALFKRFAGIDAWPVCLDTKDPDQIVRTVEAIAPVYGGINLEDISAPRCFEIEDRLRASLDIPVFHDDQHGTAIVVMAALINALRLVDKRLDDVTVALSGAGAAGMAIARLLLREGVGELLVADADGIIGGDSHPCVHESHVWLRERTNHERRSGTITDAIAGADVFIGVSAPNLLRPEDLRTMRPDPVVFALANPDPEIDPVGARQHAAVVATGRSDQPNQINNVLAFPGIFRGALDARARYITEDMKAAAARALAEVVTEDELHPSHIIPSVFSDRVVPVVADAVRRQAEAEAEANRSLTAEVTE
ncbi:NAD-dependent malic enzyme [Egicoccus halophilus]|uniref:Malate dehydrogenase n=1 Tax=Egicoccus halophilus TaxID=1670830 RepID=A0A8J3EVF4_9ACTN|nr:NAD-dependent malic enzyme [Egicoccus halophilus]GGI08016.1 malate dehydrogenase [Egicoccus halophilus]